MVALLVLLTILLFLTIDWFVQRSQLRKAEALASASAVHAYAAPPRPEALPAGLAAAPPLPAGLFVGKGHTWVRVDPTGTLRVGVDALAAALLGRPDRVELLDPGAEVKAGDPLVTLHRGSRRITLRAPVAGRITAVNPEAEPGVVADNPFGSWLYAMTPTALAESLKSLSVAEEAAAFMRREFQRLRDALAVAPALVPAPAGATLQDGGHPVEGAASGLSDAQFHELADAFFSGGR